MNAAELDFELPPELIAQAPAADRSASKLLHYRTRDKGIDHFAFAQLPQLLRAGDLLVFNDARVLPARLLLTKASGGRIEALFLKEERVGVWRMLLKNIGRAAQGARLRCSAAAISAARSPGDELTDLTFELLSNHGSGEWSVAVTPGAPAAELLDRIGRMPLPPYIRRAKEIDERDAMDRERYQTVYSTSTGAVAAPTAGLHFDQPLLDALAMRGVEQARVTLNVGIGTFKPLTVERLADHQMHVESFAITAEAAAALTRAKRDGRRIIAVGTTAARVLESQPPGNAFAAVAGETRIFIYPPYQWRHVDALITNFHLPRSTLIALVAAKVGLEEQRRIYREAIESRYRFFSYGDAMFID